MKREKRDLNRIKRDLPVLIAIFCLAACSSVQKQEAESGIASDFIFFDGVITDYIGPGGNVVIPSQINGRPVTGIGEGAFREKRLTSVTIPSGVTSIGDWAFAYNQLTSVSISSGVTSIGDSAFANNRLSRVNIPSGVTAIGDWVFANNLLTSVSIPSGVTSIGDSAFANNRLSRVSIPSGVTSIGEEAFALNLLLSRINIPPSVSSIGKGAFALNLLTSVTIGANVNLENDSFPLGFISFYNSTGKRAGIYSCAKNGEWSYEP